MSNNTTALFWDYNPYMMENMQFWLTSPKMMFSSSIYLLANNKISSFFVAEYNSTVYKDYVFLIHSSVVGPLGCFHSLAVLNNASVNMAYRALFNIT
jgi:hypothetical protein